MSKENIIKTEEYEVATFNSDDSSAEVLEGGLAYDVAIAKAKELWTTDNEYGVMVVSQDSQSLSPIKWIMSKSKIIDSLPKVE